jgi:hypothetical protein
VHLPWEEPGWRESADAWIDQALLAAGLDGTGEIDHLRERPWAAIAVVPTSQGNAYFKASSPAVAFEPPLTLELSRRRPDCIPAVLGVDVDRGWMLMREAGIQLRELLAGSGDGRVWDAVLPLYAELQIELSGSIDELLALGAHDKRPHNLPALYEALDHDRAAPVTEVERLVAEVGQVVPASIAHEEVQDNNIFVRDGQPVFIDWAEASVAHPFGSLVVTMRGLTDRWELEPGGPELLRYRDLYLEPWTRFAPLPELRRVFSHAYALGTVCRALTWHRLISPLGEEVRAEYGHAETAWLDVFAETIAGRATLGT